MALTAKQIVALLELPRIGKKKVLELGSLITGIVDDDVLYSNIMSLYDTKVCRLQHCFTATEFHQALEQAETKLEQSRELGIGWVSLYDQNYPAVLNDVKSKDGKKTESPLLLFYKGNLDLLSTPSLAVIGSRQASPQAEKAAEFLAQNFARRGITIVSGLALGCDTAAHKGALKGGKGRTIAVLGNGLDKVQPASNTELAAQILDQEGLLISEYVIEQSATNYTLIARDLLQAGISQAVIVVQSKSDGGSMHGAIAASNAGKKLYAVQYSDAMFNQSECNSGNRMLVDQYGADFLAAVKDKTQMSAYLDTIAQDIIHHTA